MTHQRLHSVELTELQDKLARAQGKQYWRSLDELAETPEFVEYLHREFPEQASEMNDPVSRRRFLQLMGASIALAGATACNGQAVEKIVPYVRQPENMIPGRPLYYATGFSLGGYAIGALAESHMGRPTKLEGNPEHPASLGSSNSYLQASILDLYDPDRSQVVLNNGRIATWEGFIAALGTELATLEASGNGSRLRILTQTVTSPTQIDLIEAVQARLPGAQWHQWEPINRDAVRAGAVAAFGEPVDTRYDFSRASVVLSLDADIYADLPGSIRYTRDFADRRRVRDDDRNMARLYSVESTPTITGASADHRWRVRASDVEAVARVVAASLGVAGLEGSGQLPDGVDAEVVDALTADLRAHAGTSLVVPGEGQPPAVHALAHAINAHLGNVGETVVHSEPVAPQPQSQAASLEALVEDMRADAVGMLVVIGGNPVYDAPADLDFAGALDAVGTRVHMGLHANETSELCHWHVPENHFLESWGDARAYDGTVTLVQPLIEPLYLGHTALELTAIMAGAAETEGRAVLESAWRDRWAAGEIEVDLGPTFDKAWRRILHDGLVPGTAYPARPTALVGGWDLGATVNSGGMEVIFRVDPTVYDGRFANNGWLQETPKPLTKLTWDNAALVSPATAERLGVANEDVVELTYDGRSVRAPIWVLPGQPDESVTLPLGYGRTRTGRVGTGTGFNAYTLRTSDALAFATGLDVAPTGRRYQLASTQMHHSMEGRDIVRVGDFHEFESTGGIQHPHTHVPGPEESLFPPYEYNGHSWGMSIDLNVCIGCTGCVTACQAENNVPVVGKTEVANGREMHWIRVDRYWSGGVENPETVFQPVACMHCDNAPCEVVCPVAATVHGSEGLNEMVYNRCVGTRYCANNCPYKVRRFNFLDYTDYDDAPMMKLLHNPDVTVRSRGVMEKCTYCVQRINVARQDAKVDGREMVDGDVVTACQQACPAQAITFGDLNDPDSAIAAAREEPLHYGLLEELGTRPRTNYMARLRNANTTLNPPVERSDSEVEHD
ncbi:MAG: 4Fe-4S dicluster domain-containing protein [Acidobacteria bacterium]|nr:4Fe-4S dicluster domain-containing protein [Acidobacteriota bacterium]